MLRCKPDRTTPDWRSQRLREARGAMQRNDTQHDLLNQSHAMPRKGMQAVGASSCGPSSRDARVACVIETSSLRCSLVAKRVLFCGGPCEKKESPDAHGATQGTARTGCAQRAARRGSHHRGAVGGCCTAQCTLRCGYWRRRGRGGGIASPREAPRCSCPTLESSTRACSARTPSTACSAPARTRCLPFKMRGAPSQRHDMRSRGVRLERSSSPAHLCKSEPPMWHVACGALLRAASHATETVP
jgi:hypothetical protein